MNGHTKQARSISWKGGARGGAWTRHFFSHQTLFCGAYKEIKSEIEGRGILRTSPSPSTV